jgi:hypothetical protein
MSAGQRKKIAQDASNPLLAVRDTTGSDTGVLRYGYSKISSDWHRSRGGSCRGSQGKDLARPPCAVESESDNSD